MKKYVKISLCGLAAMMLVSGCTKKTDESKETTAATPATTTGEEAVIDKGTLTKLGMYKGVEVTRTSVEVTDEELNASIDNILQANPEYIAITDRAAKLGDTVTIDYIGMKDGTAFEGGTADGFKLELGSGSFIDGFEEGIVGAKTGDELSLNLTFPAEYQSPDLAGQAVVFDVTVNAIEEVKEATLDNNFVQRMSDFTTVDEFKADTMASIEAEKEAAADQQLETDVFNAAVANSEFNVNPEAIEQQYNTQLEYFNSMAQAYGMQLSDMASMYGMTEDQMKEDLRVGAETAIKQQLLVAGIAKAEGIAVEDADRQVLADEYSMTIEELKEAYGADAVEETAMMFKVVSFLKDNAVVK